MAVTSVTVATAEAAAVVGQAAFPTLESSVELLFHALPPTNHTLYSNQLFFVDLFRSLALIGEWLLPARP